MSKIDVLPSHRWYVLNVITTAQANVCKRAKELGFETYYPVSKIYPLRRAGRQRVPDPVTRPLMPGYVFVSMSILAPRFDLFEQPDSDISRPEPMPLNVYAGFVADQAARPSLEPIRGCLGFITHGGAPIAVTAAKIEDMREREKRGDFDLTGKSEDGKYVVPRWVKRDACVRFVKGPFAQLLGLIDRVLGPSLMRIDVNIFGRVSQVDAPMDWIERMR